MEFFFRLFSYILFYLRVWQPLAPNVGMGASFQFALHCIAFSTSSLVVLLASDSQFVTYFAGRSLHYILRQSTYVLDKSVLATGIKWNTNMLAPTEIIHLKFPIVTFCEPDHCDEPSHFRSLCIFLLLPAPILNDTYVKKF